VLSIHPLYDTRIRNHLRTLAEGDCQITYINWSNHSTAEDAAFYKPWTLIHREANPAFGANILRFLMLLAWTFSNAWRSKPQIVHIHDIVLAPVVIPLKLLRRQAVVFDIHEHYTRLPGLIGLFSRVCYRLFLPWFDGFVSVSSSTAPRTTKAAVVIPNYQRRADFVTGPGTTREDLVSIIYFGSLMTDDRDIDLMLQTADKVISARENARFQIGGRLTGTDAQRLRLLLESLANKWPERFLWRGQMSREQVCRESAGAQLGMLLFKPNVDNVAGASPNKIFEYLAAGTAVVATDGFEVAGELRQANAGIIVSPGIDSDSLAKAIIDLIDDPPRLARMRSVCTQLAERYSWEAVGPRYLKLYESLLQRDRPGV
jgi:glycosyltransferase involved in cell wall biosynthesis